MKRGNRRRKLAAMPPDGQGFPPLLPAEQAVRWLLEFEKADLGHSSPARLEEIEAGASRFLVWSMAAGWPPETKGFGLKSLRRFQEATRQGFRGYFENPPFGWTYRVTVRGGVWSPGALSSEGVRYDYSQYELADGPEIEIFSWRAAQYLRVLHRPLRRCARPECRRPFLPTGRQTYCTRRCSDTVRLARFRGKLAQDLEQREAYLYRRKLARKGT
jgi:hypothetical protein